MSTSGQVGQIKFSFGKILDHAFRRCKLNPASQTAEIVSSAREALFLILTSLANRGPNLWRVEHGFLGLTRGVNRYDLPPGTMAVKNINFVTNSVSDGTFLSIVDGYQFDLASVIKSARIGFKAGSDFTESLDISTSSDGLSSELQLSLPSATYKKNQWYWFDLPIFQDIAFVSITSAPTSVWTLDGLVVSNQAFVIPLWQWTRDEYSMQPNRMYPGRPSTNYYFDRQTDPQIWIWPNPNNEYDHLEYWVHRQIQDINTLTEEIDVPTYCLNMAIWSLAKELCFIVPGMDPKTVAAVSAEYDRILNESEMGQSDGSPMYINPMIGVYNRA